MESLFFTAGRLGGRQHMGAAVMSARVPGERKSNCIRASPHNLGRVSSPQVSPLIKYDPLIRLPSAAGLQSTTTDWCACPVALRIASTTSPFLCFPVISLSKSLSTNFRSTLVLILIAGNPQDSKCLVDIAFKRRPTSRDLDVRKHVAFGSQPSPPAT
ncbi:hypothetical protein CDAR_36631 [Caerostris darwini]|uniref:Uncharacterized protein n=1 Tax=Caerostris darwini TaxID=1538125 RepID=A0AAV4UUJ4_9ARAC|nr:hypothetical protein CDAR_36631 [Caerostris darwini]